MQISGRMESGKTKLQAHKSALAAGLVALCTTPLANAGSFSIGDIDGEWQLQGSYLGSMRIEDPHPGVVATGGRRQIPIAEFLKVPESNNFDDGDANFAKGDMVNNRVTFLGETLFKWNDFGLLLRGDMFYDAVYRQSRNAHDNNPRSPHDSISTATNQPFNSFTEAARKFSGRRARLLDSYAFGTWFVGEEGVLNLRVGKHIAAWGESLFFSGTALSQAAADATKAFLPGADVKSILLPVNQISGTFSVNSKLTALFQYKLEFKPYELNPVGEFFSVADVIGPGAEFAYGIINPFFFSTLPAEVDGNDLDEALRTIITLGGGPDPGPGALTALSGVPVPIAPVRDVLLPFNGTPEFINVPRGPDEIPSDTGQWGVGLRYALTDITTVGLHQLRYHSGIPLPRQNYGFGVLIPGGQVGDAPEPGRAGPFLLLGGDDLTTESLGGLSIPISYTTVYADGIDLTSFSMSTVLFGLNIGFEAIWRHGDVVLVDADAGILGLVPTPTRADTLLTLMNGIYVLGPGPFWDSVAVVGSIGFSHVDNIEPGFGAPTPNQADPSNPGPPSSTTALTYDRDASGYALLAQIDSRNVFDGWDLQTIIAHQGMINNHSSVLGAFGSLFGEDDYRLAVSFTFTYLQKYSMGMAYNGFIGGTPNFDSRPLQDRDVVAFTAKMAF